MPFNVIGLISGGKDSLFSLAHAVHNGHNIVALANLCPQDDQGQVDGGESSDLNSFMYQTVGHSIIPVYAKALGLPLYRRAIQGKAHQTGQSYHNNVKTIGNTNSKNAQADSISIDETEDMHLLLSDILRHHPEANAVSAGAILSTYQRTRVESIAVRLGLTPLAFLWQYPALPPPASRDDSITGLLEDMNSAGCDARIIKIASGGIKSNLIFANVAEAKTQTGLISSLAMFYSNPGQEFALRGAVLGEGGEYETLAFDGPSWFWKKRIEIECDDTFDAEGGTIYAKLGKAVVVERAETRDTELAVPSLLDRRFVAIQGYQKNLTQVTAPNKVPINPSLTTANNFRLVTMTTQTGTTIQLCNLTYYDPNHPLDSAGQLTHIITALPAILSSFSVNITLSNIIASTLLLSTISSFTTLNTIYSQYLWPSGLPNPPARVTIAAPLPPGIDISLSLTFTVPLTTVNDQTQATKAEPTEPERKGLHVQSLSYWAPANIGPYSQAICSPITVAALPPTSNSQIHLSTPLETVHMAGQIPLVPSSMQLLQGSFTEQAVLALQHFWRVGQERRVDLWAGAGVAYLARSTPGTVDNVNGIEKAREAASIWRLAHEVDEEGKFYTQQGKPVVDEDDDIIDTEDEDFDVWDVRQNRGFGASAATVNLTVGEHLHILPNYTAFSASDRDIDRVKALGLNIPDTVKACQRPVPAFIAAEVSELPRHASVEWWSTGIAGLTSSFGREHSSVLGVSWAKQDVWRLEGIMVEHHDLERGNTSETNDSGHGDAFETTRPGHRTDGLSFFLSLTINVSLLANEDLNAHTSAAMATAPVPSTLADIQRILLKHEDLDRMAWACELVTAHSLVSLSALPDTKAAVQEMGLVQNSTVVPCHHVWTTSLPTRAIEQNAPDPDPSAVPTLSQDEYQISEKVSIAEVAAAVVLRIDVHRR